MNAEVSTSVAAKIIGCTDTMVRRLLRDGKLKGRFLARDWLVDKSSAEEYRDRPLGKGRPRTNPKKRRERSDSFY